MTQEEILLQLQFMAELQGLVPITQKNYWLYVRSIKIITANQRMN